MEGMTSPSVSRKLQHQEISNVKSSTKAILAAATALLALTACNSTKTTRISGAGSTFINPAMGRWAADYQQAHKNVRID